MNFNYISKYMWYKSFVRCVCALRSVSHLPIIFLICFNEKVLILMKSSLPISFMAYAFCVLSWPTPRLWGYSFLFYSKSFIVRSTFRSRLYLELICDYGVKEGIKIHGLQKYIWLIHHGLFVNSHHLESKKARQRIGNVFQILYM